jgi:hypothetical protein
MDSTATGLTRRAWLRAALALPWLALPRVVQATDYAGPKEALDAIDGLARDVRGRLQALAAQVASARTYLDSAERDHARLAREREALRRRLRLAAPASAASASPTDELALAGLRAAQEALVFAYAEGLPAFDDARSADLLARHLVDMARHLTLVDLWIEAEEARG